VILQVSEFVSFKDAQTVAVKVPKPSAAGTHIALLVLQEGHPAGFSVSDNFGSGPRWRQACGDGAPRAVWVRVGGPHAGVQEVTVSARPERRLSGSAIAAEVGGCSVGDAAQAVTDLLAAK
jgi:hypothetical protein